MSTIGNVIANTCAFTLRYGDGMLKDVTPATFGRLAIGKDGKPIHTNHPAWVYGHLANTAPRICELAGIEIGPCEVPAGWSDLFKDKSELRDDPEGRIYPSMEAVVKQFTAGYTHLMNTLRATPDQVLAKPNPAGGRFTEMLPTTGDAAQFLCSAHCMFHLGQISGWRRAMGLGSAF